MIPITFIGRLTKDLEEKININNKKYLVFSVAVNVGYGDKSHPLYFNCWINGDYNVDRIIHAKVKKGSLIQVTGNFDFREYTKKDGSIGHELKIAVMDWCYPNVYSKSKKDNTEEMDSSDKDESLALDGFEEIDYDMPF